MNGIKSSLLKLLAELLLNVLLIIININQQNLFGKGLSKISLKWNGEINSSFQILQKSLKKSQEEE